MSYNPSKSSFIRLFFPPFHGLPLFIWVYFLFCFLINSHSPILSGLLPDPDDYLYLTQTLDLLKGQDWFDHIQHRMNPPDGTFIHFSNLLCGLYALPIFFLQHVFDQRTAAIIAAALFPPLFFLLFLTSLRWASLPLLGRAHAGVTAYVAIFATYVVSLFSPGHVDHHGLEVLLAITAGGCAFRMEGDVAPRRFSILAGLTTSLGLVIALEFLPFLILISSWIVLRASLKGKQAAQQGYLFGMTLALASSIFLLVSRSPSSLLTFDPLAYSVIYVDLTFGITFCLAGVALADKLGHVPTRILTGLLLPIISGGLFLTFFPELRTGPLGGMDPALSQLLFDNVSEVQPILHQGDSLSWDILCLLWPGMALASTLGAFLLEHQTSRRWQWGLVGLVIASCTGLAAFYQHRFITYAQTFCILALTFGLIRLWSWLAHTYKDGTLYTARLLLLLAVGPLPVVLLPAMVTNSAFTTGVLLFPNMVSEPECNMQVLSKMLSMPVYYGKNSKVIINGINEGSEILFSTPHKILSAPYHENISGNLEAVKFFTTTDPAEAEAIARSRNADLVVLCRDIADIYVARQDNTITVTEKGDLLPSKTSSFAQQLVSGHTPSWLKPISFPLLGKMMLFETKFDDRTP